ncbi:hypothetical protein SLS60_002416 [Paraconiothyrium brasiliense]|uniref:Uncharacterized protein n=1 Tax=Paraconiothyrium brasiliense TaxID=300254 RepID=A0ABR3S235_9PLEO
MRRTREPKSVADSIGDAISLLALLGRPLQDPRPSEIVDKAGTDEDPDEKYFSSIAEDDEENVDLEDLEYFEDEAATGNPSTPKEKRIVAIKKILLDRLAEILARFKSSPKTKNHHLDAKHVCATMLREHKGAQCLQILCAKNEGLDAVDKQFLNDWTELMAAIAGKEKATDEQRSSLLDMLVQHQWPRIVYYLEQIADTFRKQQHDRSGPWNGVLQPLTAASLKQLPCPMDARKWEDNLGLQYMILKDVLQDDEHDCIAVESQATIVNTRIEALDTHLRKICDEESAHDYDVPNVENLVIAAFGLWRTVQTRTSFKASIARMFPASKARSVAERALLFLCRIKYAQEVFIEAAESIPAFRKINIVPIPWERDASRNLDRRTVAPTQVLERLEIPVETHWTEMLQSPKAQARYSYLRAGPRHMHAEMQMAQHVDCIEASGAEGAGELYPYVGCSKLCCYLCCCFLLAYRRFGFRGTHMGLTNMWLAPVVDVQTYPDLHLASERLLTYLKMALRTTLSQSSTMSPGAMRAQSTLGLSTAKLALQDLEPMEEPRDGLR